MTMFRILFIVAAISILAITFMRVQSRVRYDLASVRSLKDLINLFPHDPAYLKRAVDAYTTQAEELINQIKLVPNAERTFDNTVQAFDYLFGLSDLTLFHGVLQAITYVYPQKEMRDAATEQVSRINAFWVDVLADKQLYHAIKAYAEGNARTQSLTAEQRYFLDNTMADYKREGLDLPDDVLKQVKAINKDIADISLLFDKHIDEDKSSITVDAAGLEGVSPEFIATLEKDEQGNYIVGVDYPTIAQVMPHATSADTRKRLYLAFNNRAYPRNEKVLEQLMAKRHELAQLLGFKSYAALALDSQMVKTPERAATFIDNLIERATIKERKEFAELIANLPEGIQLSPEGKMYPWDAAYCDAYIKKTKYNIDERLIAEYFPVDHALQGMLDIYADFFSLHFVAEQTDQLWFKDLTILNVYKAGTQQLLGYIILDLYPRPDKFSHAGCQGIIPATYQEDGTPTIAVAQVMANFPMPQGDQPALFKRSDVTTFFHEFGHALHNMLGRTALASVAGTHVKRDFVEMPSQMLEEWMADGVTLKQLSRHYKTGEQLSDELIASIQALKHYSTGWFLLRQATLSSFALQLFDIPDKQRAIDQLWQRLSQQITPEMVYIPEAHFYASFGHLTGYGPKYYGYMWSKVFALDLFDTIKKRGLRNPEIGERYIKQVLGRGGSADPQELITAFLGRPPTDEAFFKDMGI